MDRVSGGTFSSDVTVPLPPVAVRYPEDTYLDRGDQLTLAMIMDSMDERPIYFATPSGILGRLGLQPWAVRHGLAAKLVPRDLNAEPPPGLVQNSPGYGEDWFDVERSLFLMENVYSFRSLENRRIWADRSTLNIPWYFYMTAAQLSDVLTRWEGGTQDQVDRLQDQTGRFLVTAQGGSAVYSAAEEGG
jgi:hypothetical protein